MKKLLTNGCCLCFSLKTGGLILGWLNMILGIIYIISSLFKLKSCLSENPDSDVIEIDKNLWMNKTYCKFYDFRHSQTCENFLVIHTTKF